MSKIVCFKSMLTSICSVAALSLSLGAQAGQLTLTPLDPIGELNGDTSSFGSCALPPERLAECQDKIPVKGEGNTSSLAPGDSDPDNMCKILILKCYSTM